MGLWQHNQDPLTTGWLEMGQSVVGDFHQQLHCKWRPITHS